LRSDRLAHGVRATLLVLLAAAFLGPSWSWDEERVDIVVVEDRSASVSPHDTDVLDRDLPLGAVTHRIESGSDLGQALREASDRIPVGGAGRIVLLSDGRSTDPVEGADHPVDTLPLATVEGPASPTLPDAIRPGEAVDLGVEPERLSVDGVAIPPSSTLDPDLGTGLHHLELGWGDVTRSARLHVREAPRVLFVVPDVEAGVPVRDALEAEHFEVDILTPSTLRAEQPDPAWYDLVLLADVPAYDHQGGDTPLPPSFLHDLRREVSGGLGLVVFGGSQSYDMGGWGESELGPVLPVETNQNDGRMGAPVTVLVILDNSGSMSQIVMEDGTNKLDLAVEGTVATREILRSFDRIGVMSFDDAPHWHLRPENVDDRGNQVARIRGVSMGGGGIYVYTSLKLAYDVLSAETTPLRHVILFSDAADSEEQTQGTIFGWGSGPSSYDLARRAWADGVTTSVIGIGTAADQDASFLQVLAERGGGRYYLTSDATELRALFMKETRRLVGSAIREKAYRPKVTQEHPITEGLALSSAPLLGGYVKLKPRPGTQVLLKGPDRDPWLILGRYGLGQVVAVAGDAGGAWSTDFTAWDQWPDLQAQIARHVLRDEASGTTAMVIEDAGSEASIQLMRRDHDGLARDDGLITLLVEGEPVDLKLIEPGWYSARVPWPEGLASAQLVVDGEVVVERSLARPSPLEFGEARPALLEQLSEQTGGVHAASWTAPIETAPFEKRRPLWPLLALLALLLMPVDAWLRRSIR